MIHHRAADQPVLDTGWIRIRDHFRKTLGPESGQGQTLSDLLVLADAVLAPRSSFTLHPHRDVEVLTLVVQGTLTHRDDQGNVETLPAGSLQLMSARDGIVHAEGNDTDLPLRLLQVWIAPHTLGGAPVYRTIRPTPEGLATVAQEAAGGDTVLPLRQAARLQMARLGPGAASRAELPAGTLGYAVTVGGAARWNGVGCGDGDGLVLPPGEVEVVSQQATTVLLFALRGPA